MNSFVLRNQELKADDENTGNFLASNTVFNKPAEEEWGTGASAVREFSQIPSKCFWTC